MQLLITHVFTICKKVQICMTLTKCVLIIYKGFKFKQSLSLTQSLQCLGVKFC